MPSENVGLHVKTEQPIGAPSAPGAPAPGEPAAPGAGRPAPPVTPPGGAKRRKKRRRPVRRRFGAASPKERTWRMWCHDVDTLLHELVKNPQLNRLSATKIVSRAEELADAYHAMQERRRPEGVKFDGRY